MRSGAWTLQATKQQFIQNGEVIQQEVEGEIIILNPENGEFFHLNGIATCIWPLLETAQTIDAVVSLVVEALNAPVEECTSDVICFFQTMTSRGLIQAIPDQQSGLHP